MVKNVLKNIINGAPCKNYTGIRLDQVEDYLIIEFRCEYSGRFDTPYARYNDPIYRGEVVEFFIGVEGDEIYYEFDLAPNNTLFNARIFYHEKYGAFTKVIDENFVLHSIDLKENEYVAALKIPFEKIGGRNKAYVYNAYRIVDNGKEKEFQALNPIGKVDFHCKDKFIKLEKE